MGISQSNHDYNHVEQRNFGNNFEPNFGFIFGWNINDQIATELSGTYTTNLTSNARQHLVSSAISGKYSFVIPALTSFRTIAILPFFKVSLTSKLNVLPFNFTNSSSNVFQYAIGPSIGTGISFLWKKYVYFGVLIQEDILYYSSCQRTVNTVPDTLLYNGGWKGSINSSFFIGVHY